MRRIINEKYGSLLLTDDDRDEATENLCCGMPSIGIGLSYHGRAGVVVEDEDQLDEEFLEQTWRRFYQKPVTIARTERLLIREMAFDDLKEVEQLYERCASEFLKPFEYTGLSVQEANRKFVGYRRAMYELMNLGLYLVYRVDEAGTAGLQRLIGRVGIEWIDDHAELQYMIAKDERNHGYATEAIHAVLKHAKKLGIEDVYLHVHVDNAASLHLAKKLGFEPVTDGEAGKTGLEPIADGEIKKARLCLCRAGV